MKKVLLTAAALFAFGFANAQEATTTETASEGFSKGNVMISGGIGFMSDSQGDSKDTNFHFVPKVGYFVTNNIAVGIALGFETMKSEDGPANPTYKTNEMSYGVFGRYYCTPGNKFSFFGELGVNAMSSKMETTPPALAPGLTTETKYKGFNVGFAPGVSYFISKCLALETSIGVINYTTSKLDNPPPFTVNDSRDQFEIGFDLTNINLGLVYKF